ncbi:MAG: hypothetical protein H7835_00550 [Magnetococcus sp. XQGC-1]
MDVSQELGLPEFQKASVLPLELNYYGAARLVADQLGIKDPPVSFVSWTHGWRHDLVRADQLVCDAHIGVTGHPDAKVVVPANKRRPYLVATKTIENLLRESGYPDTRAVGLPFCYVPPDPTVKRIPGSLLVMPAHVLMRMDARADEEEYLEYIRSIAHHFTRVVFSINLSCLSNNLWLGNLKKFGFDYVLGAGLMDQVALFRVRRLFDTFEYMTSNGIGSHFVYAGLCGVKVSLAGPLDRYPPDLHKNEPCWQIPEEREKQILAASMYQHDFIRQRFPWLYREPIDGVECVEWAKDEAGCNNKVSFTELARLFGWMDAQAQQPESFMDTVLRLDTNESVAELVQCIQSATAPPHELATIALQLLAKERVRPAYILAMLLIKRGFQHLSISLALSIGGLLFNNQTETEKGVAQLSALVDALSAEQQATLRQQILIPNLTPLLNAALERADDLALLHVLRVAAGAVPSFRVMFEARHSAEISGATEAHHRQLARHLLQEWQNS